MADTTFRTVLPDLKAVDNGDGTYSVAVSVENLPYDRWTILRTGEYYMGQHSSSTAALAANKLYACPFYVARDMTVDRIAIQVTALSAGDFARIGIYNNGTNLYPGTLVVDGGAISVGANAVVAATIAQALTKGLYWLALVTDGTPTVVYCLYSGQGNNGVLGILGDFRNAGTGWVVNQAYGALPDPFTAAGAIQNTNTPYIGLRILTLD